MGKIIYAIFLCGMITACSESPNKKLEDSQEKVHLKYISWSCECANWATLEDFRKLADADSLAEKCIYIEPANDSLQLPDTIGFNGDEIEFTGSFYKDKGFPSRFKTSGSSEKARVFQYKSYKIIKSNYRESINRDTTSESR